MNIRLLLLSVGALLATAAPLCAATHFVTTGGDDFQNPQPGSLRHAIEVLAQPGDTVKFASPIVVTLVDTIFIEKPMRIEGPGQIFKRARAFRRGAMSIDVSGVSLVNLMLKGVHVTVSNEGASEITGLVVEGCEFSAAGSLSLLLTRGARIERNKFLVAGNLDEEPALSLTQSDDALVADNMIEVRHLTGFQFTDGGNLVARGNTSNAPFSIELRSGRVTGNTVARRSMSVYQDGQDGPIVVEDNTCGSLRVTGVDLSVRRNTVQANLLLQTNYGTPRNARVDEDATPRTGLGVHVGLNIGDTPYDGPVFVEDNDITGGLTGLAFSQRVATPETSVLGNDVRGASLKGMWLSVTVPALIAGNFIEDCTGQSPGPKAALAVQQGTEDLLIEMNTLTGNRCNGIVISAEATATVKGNTIMNGTRPGIVISRDADIVAENNTIEACKRGGIFLDPSSAATLTGNTIKKTAGPGIVVSTEAVLTATNTTVEENVGAGIVFKNASKGTVTGGVIRNNRAAGVSVLKLAEADLRGVPFGGNRGAGIDIAPGGITANALPKRGNGGIDFPDELEFDGAMRKIRGEAEVGAVVQLFRSEAGALTGRRRNGEGVMLVGETVADGNGMFAIAPGASAEGDLFCLTATRLGAQPVTSEFSENIAVTPTAPIERVNVSSNEEEANGVSIEAAVLPVLSDNGRFVVFSSTATNLVVNDSNGGTDVFLRDVVNGTTERVSVNSAEEEATATGVAPSSSNATISADGRSVAFVTTATNFVPGEDFSSGFIVLRDRELGTTIGVTDPDYFDDTRPVQSRHRGQGSDPAISADGTTVAFVSSDGAFVPEDTNAWPDIFVWTRATGAYERINITSAGGQMPGGFNAGLSSPRLSVDGQLVAFVSSAALVVGNDAAGAKVFLRNRTAQTTELISLTTAGVAVSGHSPSISRDGRYVAFVTSAALVAADTNGFADVYVRDRMNGTIEFCSRKPDGGVFLGNAQMPALSGGARYLAFVGPGGSIFGGGATILHPDLFVLDRQTGVVVEAGIGIAGEAGGTCRLPSLSNDGRFLTFESEGANLVENDTNGLLDIFIRDRAAELAAP